MASYQREMRRCGQCEKSTEHLRTLPNTLFHLVAAFFTAGLWLIIWLFFIHKGNWGCTKCGN